MTEYYKINPCCKRMRESGESDFDAWASEIYGNPHVDVNSCCGGCYVIHDITHCPFCGTKIALTKQEKK